MEKHDDGRIYVEVTATTLPDGRIAPRLIRWRDGRLLPVMNVSGGPSALPAAASIRVLSRPASRRLLTTSKSTSGRAEPQAPLP